MNLKAQLAILVDHLKIPSSTELIPWLSKLLAMPDSVVIISIEKPLDPTGPHVGIAWISGSERLKLRKALVAINDSRAKRSQPSTSEIPQ